MSPHRTVWSCSHCGPHPDSTQTWCAAGCGSDYSSMVELQRSDPLGQDDPWGPWRTRVVDEAIDGYEATLERRQRADAIKLAHAAVQTTRADHLAATRTRNALIIQALEAGVKQADIARITGLSRARIAQLK